MTALQWDYRPAFKRLCDIMRWDEMADNGPPIVCAPRPLPPARQDAATVARFARTRAALARARQGRAA